MVVTLRVWAILVSISKEGCILLEHHLETVEGSLPSCSASHLPVFFCSTKTTFSLFKSFILLQFIGVFRKFSASRDKNKIKFFIFYYEAKPKLFKFNTSRAENKANSFVFYPEAQLKLLKFNTRRVVNKINSFFYPEPKFKLSEFNSTTPQIHSQLSDYTAYSRHI